jgi:hypothetical protein
MWAQACDKVQAAERVRNAAHRAAESNPCSTNLNAFLAADKAFHQAVKDRESVRTMKKLYRLGEA